MTESAPAPRRRRKPSLARRAQRAADAFVNGLDWWMREPEQVVDRTPWRPILQRDKLTVRRYTAAAGDEDWGLGAVLDGPTKQRVPVLLVPPLMVKPFIFDLVPDRSLVRTLLGAGFDVTLVDFGEPDAADERVRLDDYVLDWLPAAIEATKADTGADQVALCGYCMGGLFALMTTAVGDPTRAGDGPRDDIAAIVTIGSPIDSAKMGVLSVLARLLHRQVDFVSERLGNVPGELSSQVFKWMSPWKSMTRHADLFLHLYDQTWVDGHDALSAWTGNFIDYPGDAFRQLMDDFMTGNKLKDGRMRFGARTADLSRLRVPVLAFAGETDNVVRPEAVHELMSAVGSADKEVRMAPGGHMGVFAGSRAPTAVWRPAVAWLRERLANASGAIAPGGS